MHDMPFFLVDEDCTNYTLFADATMNLRERADNVNSSIQSNRFFVIIFPSKEETTSNVVAGLGGGTQVRGVTINI